MVIASTRDQARIEATPPHNIPRAALAGWLDPRMNQVARTGTGLLCARKFPARGGRPGRPAAFMRQHTLSRHVAEALKDCKLPALTWYQATRHSFASQWVLAGASMEKLAMILGHGTTAVTERYAHMRPDLFPEADYDVLDVTLSAGSAPVAPITRRTSRKSP